MQVQRSFQSIRRNFRFMSGEYRRIVVVGTSCSGKTTIARRISNILEIPHIELDAIHWKPGWQETSSEEFRELVSSAISQGSWVVDGNYSKVRDIVWSRADTLIWLNYKFWVVFSRALKRSFKRFVFREELFSGNRETLKNLLSKDCIPLWVLKTHHRKKKNTRIFSGRVDSLILKSRSLRIKNQPMNFY